MILSVIPFISTKHGGSAYVARNLHRLLGREGTNARLVTTEDAGALGIPGVVCMPLTCRLFYFSFAWAVRAPREVRGAGILLIHNLYNFVSLYATLLAVVSGRPYLFFPHGMLDRDSIYSAGPLKNMLRWCYVVSIGWLTCRFARAVLFNSEKERSNSFFGSGRNARIIPNGVDFRKIHEQARALRSTCQDRTRLLFLGRLHSIKGLDLIVEALLSLPVNIRDRIQVTLAGEGNHDYVDRLKEKLGAGGLLRMVAFPGMVEGGDKYRLLANADIYLQPSKTEGLSISMLEAMASGTAMITTRNVGLADELERRQAACLIDYDAEQLAGMIVELVQNQGLRESLAARAVAMVKESYDWPLIVERYVGLIDNLRFERR